MTVTIFQQNKIKRARKAAKSKLEKRTQPKIRASQWTESFKEAVQEKIRDKVKKLKKRGHQNSKKKTNRLGDHYIKNQMVTKNLDKNKIL